MAALIKKRFKGWGVVLIVIAALVIMFVVYAAPIAEHLWKVFPGIANFSFVSNLLKDRVIQKSGAQSAGQEQEGGAAGAEEKQRPVSVIVFKAVKSDFEDTLLAMGTIKGVREIELRFEANGVIDAINFREGDFIKKGDVVAVLNQQDAILKLEYSQSKLKTSQTQMLTAKKKLEIHQKLYELGTIIKSKLEEVALEYENTKSQVTSAEKEVAFAKQEVQKAYISSPIDGIIGEREAEAGEFVTSNTKIATVIDVSSVYAEVGIIEKDLQKIALDIEATATVDAYPDVEFKGKIDNILPTIEGKSRTITCRIKIDNQDGMLLPGMFVRATIFVFGQKDVIVLSTPNNTLRDTDNDGKFDSVFVVDQDNVAHLKPVEISYLTTDNAVVVSGLEEGEQVVTEARAELSDGAPVEVLETQEGLKPQEELPGAGGEKEMVIQ